MKRNPDLGAAIDERLTAAIDKANFLITLNNQKQNARLKLEVDLTYATCGGIFKVSPELISFITTLRSLNQTDGVLLDNNQNPIYIPDLEKFQTQIVDVYYSSMNEFLAEFKKIQKSRKTELLVS